jgi:hypothetical protein
MEKAVNLLWTSGWDSTYRLLELLLVHEKPVQPYYLFDRNRQSYELEVKAMDNIKALLFKKSPKAEKLMRPTIYKEVSKIKPNAHISGQFQEILKLKRNGTQYEWLARYADEIGVDDLELCVDMVSPGFFSTYIKPNLVKEFDGKGYNFRLMDHPENPVLTMYRYFRFPVQEYTKRDLQRLAVKHGFIDLMNHTWFCHTPINGQPCGLCVPCKVTMEHGMRRRIPFTSQVRNFVHYQVKPPLRKLLGRDKAKAATPAA